MVKLMKPLAKVTMKAAKIKPVAKLLTKVSHNKPEIMAIGGGVILVWAFVEAIRSGMKVPTVMEETASNVAEIEARHKEEMSRLEEGGETTATDILEVQRKELKKARAEGTWKVVKLILLPSGLLVIGMCLMGGGFRVLKTRNIVLAASAEGYKKTLDFYRKNVIADQGKDADLKYLRGVIDGKDVETVIKDENGEEKVVKRHLPVVKEQKGNPWRFEFSDTYFNSYKDDTDSNLFFLKCEEDWWNHELERYGEVSMYEVLKHMGYKFDVLETSCSSKSEYRERTTFLRNYGWRKGCGDGFIDFGLYRAINEAAISRKSDVVFVEFNCAGNLQNLSEKNYMKK